MPSSFFSDRSAFACSSTASGESPESILSLERNQDLTILTEINKRGADNDISFNFRVSPWTNIIQEIEFN